MTNFNNFVKLSASIISTFYSIGKVYELNENIELKEEKRLNNIIADGCNLTYQTYVSKIKKNNNKLNETA